MVTFDNIQMLKTKVDEIFSSYEKKIINLFEKTNPYALKDFSCNLQTPSCDISLPLGVFVKIEKHLKFEKKGYVDCKIKFLTTENIIERTLIRISYQEGYQGWITDPFVFNKIVTNIKYKKTIELLFEEILLEISKTIKEVLTTNYEK